VVVDGRTHGSPAGLDQRDEGLQRWQAEPDGEEYHVGPPGGGEADGFDAEEPKEGTDGKMAEQDGRHHRKQGGSHGNQ
jgi:hypothetical protein